MSLLTFEALLKVMKLHSNPGLFVVYMVCSAQFDDFISINSSFKYDSCTGCTAAVWTVLVICWAKRHPAVKVETGLHLVEKLFQNLLSITILQQVQ